MAISKLKLSGSTNGRGILVVQTATAGTLLHTATNTADILDEIWLYVTNNHSAPVDLTIEMGGVTSPNDLIKQEIPETAGLYLVIAGLLLDGGVVARAFASQANVLSIFGFVNRIDQS
jgi:hypothetical protein